MRIMLTENDPALYERIYRSLVRWEFDVAESVDSGSIISDLNKIPDIQILIIGKTNFDTVEIIHQVRQLNHYVYLICLYPPEDTQLYRSFMEAGSDSCVELPVSEEELRLTLLSAKRLLNHSFQFSSYNISAPDLSKKQVLNLQSALGSVNQENVLLAELVEILINSAKELDLKSDPDKQGQWEELYQNAEAFGAEILAEKIKWILASKKQYGPFFLTNLDFFEKELNRSIRQLNEAIGCLREFRFFAHPDEKKKENPLENAKVLLVEDMLHNRILVKQILKKHNAKVVEVTNGEEALENWEQQGPYDLIIMDMNMPIMDGFTATKLIREKEEQGKLERTPILALTALAMKGDKELCLIAGCDSYLPKPVSGQALRKVCGQLISNVEISDEDDPQMSNIQIKRVLAKTKNQVYQFCLKAMFKEQGIDARFVDESHDVFSNLSNSRFDLIILDVIDDLEVGYYIKEKYPLQLVVFIIQSEALKLSPFADLPNHISFPFNSSDLIESFQIFSKELIRRRKEANIVADITSISALNIQSVIDECINKSDGQISVWQKSLGKIGGDLVLGHNFDLHGKFGFILADVSGHDAKSGYAASWFSGLVKGLWGQFSMPVDLLVHLNNLFAHEEEEEDKRYVCALVLLWDRMRSKLYYANAGIPGGILLRRKTNETEMINWKGMPIGMFPNIDMFDYGEIDFMPGDRLCMATDGVLENIPNDVIVGLSEDQMEQNADTALKSIVDFVTRSIEVKDDLTISVFDALPLPEIELGFRESILSNLIEIDTAMGRIEKFIQEKIPGKYDWAMVSIAIKEAFINAVEHGNKKGGNLPIDYDIEIAGDKLIVKISDTGGGFDLSSVKKRLKLEGQLRINGRGVDLMEHISDSMEYIGGGVKLQFAPV